MRTLCLAAVLAFTGSLAAQNVFTVTNVNDSGAGSLRQAIMDANATPNQTVSMVPVADEIRFGSGVTGTINLASQLPVITEGVNVIGPGRSLLTIHGGGNFRAFESSLGHYLGVSRLTLHSCLVVGDGGAILSRGFTVISDVAFRNCHAVGASSGSGPGTNGRGGAICHSPLIAELWVTNSLFQDCTAGGGSGTGGNGGNGFGGGIYLGAGVGRISLSTFDTCAAYGGHTSSGGLGGKGAGGAIYAVSALDLDDLVIFDGFASGGDTTTATQGGGTGTGAGIFADTDLDALRVTITNCQSAGGLPGAGGAGGDAIGGGVTNESGTSVLRLCVIEGCGAATTSGGAAYGGGIYAESSLTVRESHINACLGTDLGAGIYYEGSGTVMIDRSTISNCNGVGIRANGGTSFTIINSTISGNGPGSTTGGIWNSGAVMQISFSTITDNQGSTWGGVYRTGGTLGILGSIIAGNIGSGSSTDLAAGGSMTIQNSVVGIQDPDAIAVNGSNGNQVGSAGTPLGAMLGPLVNNGGPTPTHALLTGSPAINMGGSTGVPSTDQRNALRNQGVADAGSYEFGATPPNTGGTAGGKGDDRCSTGTGGAPWLMLAGLAALLALGLRRVRVQ